MQVTKTKPMPPIQTSSIKRLLPVRHVSAAALSLAIIFTSIGATASQGTAAAADVQPRVIVHHAPVIHVVAAPKVVHLVSAADIVQWSRVAMCEEGGNWHVRGPRFSGGLGISNANWRIYGGTQFASNAGLATPEQQIVIAKRIQRNPPDQYGCTGAW
jgi:hypothetical protein